MKTRIIGLLAILSLGSGCASLVSGTCQHVPISSNPSGATVKVDGNTMGTTPLAVDLKRKDYHSISVEMDGYHPYQIETTKGINPWLLGDIVIFPYLPWFGIDFLTGAYATIHPAEVSASLSPIGASGTGVASLVFPPAAVVAPTPVDAQHALHLKDGSIIRGHLLEIQPGKHYRIRRSDGSEQVFPSDSVESVDTVPISSI